MKKNITFLLIMILVASFLGTWQTAGASSSTWKTLPTLQNKLDASVTSSLGQLPAGQTITVIVTLNKQADLSRVNGADRAARQSGVVQALQTTANATQGQLKRFLESRQSQGLLQSYSPFWVFNGFSVTATGSVINELSHHPDVYSITSNDIQIVPAAGIPEPNISLVNAPAIWSQGYSGQGVVIASMDSGVDVNHPDLSARWRGGSNSWYDPYGQHPSTPTDLSGHGTQTMGIMVGGDLSGTSIGVAPAAQWIAVKMFNDAGGSTATAIHLGYQWLLDPDGDPGTADAPQVVNNSWTYANPGCYLDFEPDLGSLRAAGILPVFAAGNGGPYTGTSYSPANNPSAFAVGAVDNNDQIYAYSSRGPSTCGGSTGPYPELVAPGVNIKTAGLFGSYPSETGTSFSSPHVAGGLALLLSAYPNLDADLQEQALIDNAVDLGSVGPDDIFGYGRLDLQAAYQWLQTNAPTPTPAPTNLALNQPVTVSSSQDSSHGGAQAVDGNMATSWQSKLVKGKRGSSSEWIVVDLGGNASINEVVLAWDANYATSYTIQVSNDASSWTTVFNTSSGNGGNDTISLSVASARYVRMESTAWSDANIRNWLKEFKVYGNVSSTPIPTDTPTPTPAPTQTPPPSSGAVHVSDLDGSSSPGSRSRWDALVVITIHDDGANPVSGATVTGSWSAGGSNSCVTNSQGQCSLSKSSLKGSQSNVTFTVDDVSYSSYTYQPADNGDPDGDSNGTNIVIYSP